MKMTFLIQFLISLQDVSVRPLFFLPRFIRSYELDKNERFYMNYFFTIEGSHTCPSARIFFLCFMEKTMKWIPYILLNLEISKLHHCLCHKQLITNDCKWICVCSLFIFSYRLFVVYVHILSIFFIILL